MTGNDPNCSRSCAIAPRTGRTAPVCGQVLACQVSPCRGSRRGRAALPSAFPALQQLRSQPNTRRERHLLPVPHVGAWPTAPAAPAQQRGRPSPPAGPSRSPAVNSRALPGCLVLFSWCRRGRTAPCRGHHPSAAVPPRSPAVAPALLSGTAGRCFPAVHRHALLGSRGRALQTALAPTAERRLVPPAAATSHNLQ